MHDVVINSCPKSLSEYPTDETHTLKFRKYNDYTIPMDLKGILISCFPSRKPTKREYQECRHIEMTADSPEWNPHARLFDENEHAMTDEEGFLKPASRRQSIMELRTNAGSLFDATDTSELISVVPRVLSDISNMLNDCLFVRAIRLTVELTYDDYIKAKTSTEPTAAQISSAKTKPRYKLTAKILSQKWNIGLEAAKRTLRLRPLPICLLLIVGVLYRSSYEIQIIENRHFHRLHVR
jgi:hypothetical protein